MQTGEKTMSKIFGKLPWAAVLAAALFSQSALAYGAVWKYGGNFGFGRGVGAVADYETQEEADDAALGACLNQRPDWAATSKWGECRIAARFQNRCAVFSRFIIQGVRAVRKGGETNVVAEDHSSVLFYHVEEFDRRELQELIKLANGERTVSEESQIRFMSSLLNRHICGDYVRNHPDMGKNVNPKYRAAADFHSFRVNCDMPTHAGAVCDNVGFEMGN